MKKKNLNNLFDKLFPILRSITGEGYRQSFEIFSKYFKFKKFKYPSGKKVFDWTVPKEWQINDAYVKFNGKKIIDLKKNNLHVMNYSARINKRMNLNKLNNYLYSIKSLPNAIPYVTSYYKKNIGFSIKHRDRKKLKKGNYDVFIDSKFINGYVLNGVSKLKGKTNKIILLSSYLCHPSLANNELSGPLSMLGLYERIKKWKKRNFNYLFLLNPETIGSICFLSTYKDILKKNLYGGLVLTCLGGPNKKLSYKKSRFGNSPFDKIFVNLERDKKVLVREFDPSIGSDERQYCSSEFNLPVGQIGRTVHGTYKEYHNSLDNKKFMKISQLVNSIDQIENILKINENLKPLKRYMPYCELQLGKRNLYPNINAKTGEFKDKLDFKNLKLLKYVLSYADGQSNILDIANKSNFKLSEINKVVNFCVSRKLLIE